MKVAIYLRVSTKKKQDINTQLLPIQEYCKRSNFEVYNIYQDIGESGSKESRPQFDLMLQDMRKNKFKTIAVYKLDRIGRSMQHLLNLFEEFNKRGIEFISLTQNIDTTTPEGRMFLKMLMVLSEYERELIINRVNAGIRRAREYGTKSGKPIGRPIVEANLNEIMKLKESGMSLRSIAKELNLSLGKVQRCIKTQGEKWIIKTGSTIYIWEVTNINYLYWKEMVVKHKITNLSEWALVFYLEKNPGAIKKKISKDLNVHLGRVYYVMNKLIKKGIVIQKQSELDKRSFEYYLVKELK